MLQAALADKDGSPVIVPLSILQRPDRLDDCHSESGIDFARIVERKLELTIATDGAIKTFTLPESSPEWMKDLSGCALKQFRFAPATSDGKPVETRASLTIKFRARTSDQSAGFAIEKVGPLIIPPRIWISGTVLANCIEASSVTPGATTRFVITFTVLPDGSTKDLDLSPGSERFQKEIASCVLRRAKFSPGTVDGLPVEAEAKMPISLTNGFGKTTQPELRSTDEELEAAYRACYPPDLLTMTSILYSFNIGTGGKVSNPKLVKGTGDPRLDEAGTCILKRLEFTPMMQNGRAVKSYVTWELPMRPPR